MKKSLKIGIGVGGITLLAIVLYWTRMEEQRFLDRLVTLSQVYDVNQIYKSMKGPQSTESYYVLKTKEPELLWITGYHAVMVQADGKTPASQEFMCHSNLDFADNKRHNELFRHDGSERLFTLSQGQFDIKFPDGFGIPMMSDEALNLTTQVLNLNIKDPKLQVRHRVTIDFARDRDLKRKMVPLMMVGGSGLKLLQGKEGYYGIQNPEEEAHGPGCSLGTSASTHSITDQFGRVFAGHWVVKPGREVNHSLATHYFRVPFDSTIHYIAVHLHPFAETLELRDLTAKKRVFLSRAENFKDKIGLKRVEYFISKRGILVYKDHQYELVSVYVNPTEEDQDAMATMLLYIEDKNFDRGHLLKAPQKEPTSSVASPKK